MRSHDTNPRRLRTRAPAPVAIAAIALCVAAASARQAPPEPPPSDLPDPPNPPPAHADPDDATPPQDILEYDADSPKETLDEDSVFKKLSDRLIRRDVLFRRLPDEAIDRGWQELNRTLEEGVGLRLGFAYTALYQKSTNSEGGSEGFGGDLDLFGIWKLPGSEEDGNAGYLGFAAETRYAIGSRPPSGLGREFGAFSRTTQSFNEQDFSLVEFWWNQEFFDDALEVTVGKLSPRSFYNTNRLRNQNNTFMNQVFTGNRAIGFPGRGPGLNITWRPDESGYLTAGIHDANGQAELEDFSTLDDGEFVYIAEYGWTPMLENLGRGNYRFTLWYSDPSEFRGTDEGWGVALSLDQDLDESLIGFVRYAYADGDARGARQTLSGGVGVVDPFGRENDLIGLGLGWSDPKASGRRDEYVAEIFYRLQVTAFQQLTVGWQTYVDPAIKVEDDVVGVLGLRWRIQF
ncbi:MAG: carbohydrate porin [Planctomycetota bacterium]|jgi:porin